MSYVSRYEVTLNGISLASIDPNIAVLDVQYEKPQYARNFFQLADRHGARPGKAYKERAAVSILFEIHTQDIFIRQTVCQAVVAWAKDGGELQINDRPGQKLVCICEEMPSVESVMRWTDTMTITFAAYEVPYWQEVNPTVVTGQCVDGTTTTDWDSAFTEFEITVPGNAPYTLLEMTIDGFTSLCNRVYIENTSRNDGMFKQEGYATLPANVQKIVLEYDENMILNYYYDCYNESQSLYYKDHEEGWLKGIDEVRLNCGQTNHIRLLYGNYVPVGEEETPGVYKRACNVTFTARGLWE